MPKRAKPCPCSEDKNEFVPYTTWQRHTRDITQGKRRRWDPDVDAPAPVTQEQPNVQQADDEAERPVVDPTARDYSTELVELVARGVATVTGVEAILKAQHGRYQEHLKGEVSIPPSWYKAKKMALEDREIKWFSRDFCPRCDDLRTKSQTHQTTHTPTKQPT